MPYLPARLMLATLTVDRRRGLWLLLAPIGTGLTIGLGLLVLAAISPPSEGSAEVMFARAMAAHHEQAVEMGLIVRDRSADPELRQLALDIILTQQAQIGQMQGWLAVWKLPLAGSQPPTAGHTAMMRMASRDEINALRMLPVPEAETMFLQLMIRHHEGGIAMARDAVQRARRSEVVRLAQTIVSGQQAEIDYMRDLLRRRAARP